MKHMQFSGSEYRWQFYLTVLAALAILTAFVLWQIDGAWDYGSMPTKGLIRTFLFGVAGIICLGISMFLRRHNAGR